MVFAKVSRAVIYKIKSILISYFVLLSDFLLKVFAVLNKSCTFALAFGNEGRLAQLVQSICLTSRGSAVRIRQRPQDKDANGSLAQLNRASDYGSEGYRFESCANHHI